MTKERLAEIKRITDAATPPNGLLHKYCPEVNKEQILSAIAESIDASAGKEWHWIASDGDYGCVVAHFGNGPTSSANADLWLASRTIIPELLSEIERLQHIVENKDVGIS